MNTNAGYRDKMLIMRTKEGWYPIEASGTKPLDQEAADHGEINPHVFRIETIEGEILWSRQ